MIKKKPMMKKIESYNSVVKVIAMIQSLNRSANEKFFEGEIEK